jgi:hypothetical protein
MNKKFISTLAITSVLDLFTGCASYNAISLNEPSLQETLLSTNAQTEKISIVAKRFNKTDCQRYLDRDVISKGYQPIQLYIQNNSKSNYVFSLHRVSLNCASAEEVADKVHTSTIARAVGYGAGAILLWPLAIPAVIDGVGSANANEALDNDYYSKTAQDQVIFPYAHINKLLFVSKYGLESTFTVTLMNQETKALETITVALN